MRRLYFLIIAALLVGSIAVISVNQFGVEANTGQETPVASPLGGFLIFVNSTGDGGNRVQAPNCDADLSTPGPQCTLRAAIEAANASAGADGIDFAIPPSEPGCNFLGQCVINLTHALPVISEDVELTGPGATHLTVRRNTGGDYPIFDMAGTGTFGFSGITIENGYASPATTAMAGGGFNAPFASGLSISNCIVRGTTGPNLFNFGAAILAGGGNTPVQLDIENTMVIDNAVRGVFVLQANGVVDISKSTIARNNTSGQGGGVWSLARTTINNSTISDNFALNNGGGILTNTSHIPNPNNLLRIFNSTITGNSTVGPSDPTAGYSAGIWGPAILESTIVVGNFKAVAGNPASDVDSLLSQGHNLIGAIAQFAPVPGPGDQFGVTPIQAALGTLQNNGGPTHTIAIDCTSIAIDAGSAGTLTTDQRGPGFPRVAGPGADVGAFERQSCNTPPTIISTPILRSRGSAGRAVIANVSDLEDPEESLVVTANNSDVAQVNGVKVSAIAVSTSGEVSALIDVACNAEIAEFDLKVTDSGGLIDQAILLVRLEGACNTAPSIASAPIHRPRGSSGNFQIATVSDAEDAEENLVMTLNAGPSVNINGVSVSNLAVNSDGIVTADIAVACGATPIMPALGVTDSSGATTLTTLDILVDPSSPPVLSLDPSRAIIFANGTYRLFTVNGMVRSATDDCSGNLFSSIVIEKVTSDEADNLPGNSDGNTVNDIVIGPFCRTVLLRAERNTNGNGRVYSVTLKVADSEGQVTRAVYKVAVPVSLFGTPAVEGIPQLTVLGGCR